VVNRDPRQLAVHGRQELSDVSRQLPRTGGLGGELYVLKPVACGPEADPQLVHPPARPPLGCAFVSTGHVRR